MKKLYFLLIVFGFSFAKAQVVYDYLKAADNYFKNGDYYSAAEYYEKYLGKGKATNSPGFAPYAPQLEKNKKSALQLSSREQAAYNLAESYRNLHLHEKAVQMYKQAADLGPVKFPLARYWYAISLRSLAQYEEAGKAFGAFLTGYGAKDKFQQDAEREIANLQFIQQQLAKKETSRYTIIKAGDGIPGSGAVYAPVIFKGTLYFTSTRTDSTAPRLQAHNNRVYQASYTHGMMNNVRPTPLAELKDMHQGVISISPDGNTLFLTRWTITKGKKNASIYSSKKNAEGWSDPAALTAPVNLPGFSSQQAFVMPGGRQLIFSSDRPGGLGGFDLWSAELDEAGNLSAPVNLGPKINTINDEQAPYYHPLSGSLVFSSNGRVGMGGYDFYYSKKSGGDWGEPLNFGYPVNSVKDDIYFTSKATSKYILEEVLFSSDRDAACCLELFSLKMENPLRSVSGQVISCVTKLPVAGAVVTFVDSISQAIITSKVTDLDGRYSFTLKDFQPLKATATAGGYFSAALSFNSPADENATSLTNPEICLSPIEVEKPILLNNVLYEFNKSELEALSFPELDKLVTLLLDNPGIAVEISAHTDSKGTDVYNQRLSDARAQSVVAYLVSKGIDASRLKAVGYAATKPVAPNTNDDGTDNPEGRKLNRRTEFKVLKN